MNLSAPVWVDFLQPPDVPHASKNCGERDHDQSDDAPAKNDSEDCKK